MSLEIYDFFDEPTFTVTYLVIDNVANEAAIVDSVLDFDYASGRTHTRSADQIIELIKDKGALLKWIIETHVHADHLSAAPHIEQQLGGTIVIGEHICQVQKTFSELFNLPEFAADGTQFGKLMADGDTITLGEFEFTALHTPGHTPACMSYHIDNFLFVGDTIFMPDYGSARCDFPGGDAGTLYDSVMRLFSYPDDTNMMLCHDYKSATRNEFVWRTTVGEQKANNIHLKAGTTKAAFVEMRESRDATLSMPRLIVPSVQVNMAAGELPAAESNGVSYLKVPLNLL